MAGLVVTFKEVESLFMVDILSDFCLPAFFSLAARNLPSIAEEWIYSMHIMLFDTNVRTYKHIQAWHVHIHLISRLGLPQ